MGVLDLGRVIAGTNPNLLINSEFTNAVNKTGIISGQAYHGWMQFIDEWDIGYNDDSAYAAFSNGIGIALNNGTILWQYLEMLYTDLFGKTFTVTFKKSDNTFHSATLAFPSSVNGVNVGNVALIADVGTVQLGFEYRAGGAIINGKTVNYVPMVFITSNNNQTLKGAKLEIGSNSTMFMDAPTDYAETERICQRYYRKFDWLGGGTNFAPIRVIMPIPGGPMRTIPTESHTQGGTGSADIQMRSNESMDITVTGDYALLTITLDARL